MPSIRRLRTPAFTSAGLLFLCLALLTLGACQRQSSESTADAPPPPRPVTEWTQFRDASLESYFKAHPVFAVSAGRHEFDGQLPDWSKAGIAAEIARLHAERDRAAGFEAGSLSGVDRFERDYLVARFDRDLFWLETAEAPFRNPAFYLDWMLDGLDPGVYLTRNYKPLDQRMRAYIDYLKSIPTATAQIEKNLRLPMPAPLLERGISAFGGLADFYRNDVPRIFSMITDTTLQQDFSAANEEAIKAMRKLAGWLEVNRKRTGGSFALGKEKFAQMLSASEGVDIPLDELEKIGQADLARNLAALEKACTTFLPGKPVAECIKAMQDNKPAGGPVKGARGQLESLRAALLGSEVVTVPGEEKALVNEAPPYNRANSAYIDIPGPYDTGLPAIYYIAPADPSWSAEEQHDFLPGQADLLFTSVHEVWPGHFLQFLHSNRNESIVGRLFVGYAFAEGWAHYAEEMMWEVGLNEGDAETHIGQLANALLRNVRFLSAIGLHARGMTLAQSEKMFREKAFSDPGTARQQAARGAYDPAYLNYTMGKLMIRKLRKDWCASRGGRECWREFHDTILSYGGPPVPMVRAAMMGSAEGSLF